eukprot:221482-Heterocapsa_arctica.AAC.1
MVIARMPEDRSKPLKTFNFKAVYTSVLRATLELDLLPRGVTEGRVFEALGLASEPSVERMLKG